MPKRRLTAPRQHKDLAVASLNSSNTYGTDVYQNMARQLSKDSLEYQRVGSQTFPCLKHLGK